MIPTAVAAGTDAILHASNSRKMLNLHRRKYIVGEPAWLRPI